MSRTVLVFLFSLTLITIGFSQQDSVATESVVIKKKKDNKPKKRRDYSNLDPHKATLFAIIPGGGQIYNKRYWKIPIVWGALATTGYFAIHNGRLYNEYVHGLNWVQNEDNAGNEDPGGNSDWPLYTDPDPKGNGQLLAESQLREAKDFHQRQRDFNVILFTAIYFLQMVEASVDAHLLKFHDSDNFLSLKPKVFRVNQQDNVGLALTLHLK